MSAVKRLLKHYDQLVEIIYHSAVEPEEWQTLLSKLVELLGGCSACMLFLDGTAKSEHASYTVNLDEGYYRQYVDYYMNVSPWRLELQYKPKGRFYSTFLDFSHDQNFFHRSELYNDWARPQEIEHGLCANVVATQNFAVQLMVQRTSAPGHFTHEETEAMNALATHIRRALALQRRFEEEQRFHESMLQAKWRAYLPCILLNERLKVVHLDDAVTPLLAACPELRILHDKVSIRDERLNNQLQRHLKECAAAVCGQWMHAGECVRLQHPGGLLELHAYPIHPAYKGLFNNGGHYVALYLNDPKAHYTLNERLVREIFGISPAELRLAEAICNGQTIEEFAAKNGTTLNTVRSQLKQLFAKTGVSRQAEVPIRLLSYMLVK